MQRPRRREQKVVGKIAVGQRTRRIDWRSATTGRATYVDDLEAQGLLTARFLRSPHPHARIVELDVSRARALPGVVAVVTWEDFGEQRYTHHGPPLADRRPLARDRVRYIGEEVAAVAAETAEQAEAALAAIRVRYQRLPAASTLAEAQAPGAVSIHDDHPGNLARSLRLRYGKPAVADDAVTVPGRYYFNRQTHLCMETNRTTVLWNPDSEILEVWTSTQVPYFIRKELAGLLGLERAQVKIRQVAVGGGFGSKSKISEHESLVAALALRAPGRPVRVVYTREEEFTATKPRHDFDMRLETSARPDGTLLGHRADITVDNGAYNHYGPSVMASACRLLASLYRSPGVEIDADLVYTNKQPGGQFRGYGLPQATFALECQMDELAGALGIDPIDLRLRNLHEVGEVTHAGWHIIDTGLAECLQAVRERTDWDAKRELGGSGRGIGLAVSMHPSGSNAYLGSHRSEAWVTVGADGEVVVGFGSGDAGTGQRTLIAQVAAEELGLAPGDVTVVMMDSDATPTDFGAWSSRGTHMAGQAVGRAARAAADGLRGVAAEKFRVAPADVTLRDGLAIAGDDQVPLGDLVDSSGASQDGRWRFEGVYEGEHDLVDPEGRPANISPTYAFAAHAVEVEVDRDTGKVRVLSVVAAHDSGTPISPIDFEGQVYGGVAMGLGAALGEEVVYEGGRVVNPSYLDYATPRAADLPPIDVIAVVHHDPAGPYGAKGIGEIALNPTPAALANAVAHAIGARVRDLPITPDKVLGAIREAEGRPQRSYHLVRRPGRWWVASLRWLYPRGLHALLHRYGTRLARRVTPREIQAIERPGHVTEATALLEHSDAQAVAGATDLLPAREQRLAAPAVLVDVRSLPGMGEVADSPEGDLVIGGAVTLAALARHVALAGASPQRVAWTGDGAVVDAVESIASAQVREVATVAGNLLQAKRCWFYRNGFPCYKRSGPASPCYAVLGDHRFHHAVLGAHRCQAVTPSDLATVFAALDAVVTVESRQGSRELSMADLYTGPGETVVGSGELLTEVRIGAHARARSTRFDKLTLWEGDFAVVSVAASVLWYRGRVGACRLVLGGVAPTPYRAQRSEALLTGRSMDERRVEAAAEAWARDAHPLEHNGWKVDAAVALLRRSLMALREDAHTGAGE